MPAEAAHRPLPAVPNPPSRSNPKNPLNPSYREVRARFAGSEGAAGYGLERVRRPKEYQRYFEGGGRRSRPCPVVATPLRTAARTDLTTTPAAHFAAAAPTAAREAELPRARCATLPAGTAAAAVADPIALVSGAQSAGLPVAVASANLLHAAGPGTVAAAFPAGAISGRAGSALPRGATGAGAPSSPRTPGAGRGAAGSGAASGGPAGATDGGRGGVFFARGALAASGSGAGAPGVPRTPLAGGAAASGALLHSPATGAAIALLAAHLTGQAAAAFADAHGRAPAAVGTADFDLGAARAAGSEHTHLARGAGAAVALAVVGPATPGADLPLGSTPGAIDGSRCFSLGAVAGRRGAARFPNAIGATFDTTAAIAGAKAFEVASGGGVPVVAIDIRGDAVVVPIVLGIDAAAGNALGVTSARGRAGSGPGVGRGAAAGVTGVGSSRGAADSQGAQET